MRTTKESVLERRIKAFVVSHGGVFYKNPPTRTGRLDCEWTLPEYHGVWVIAETKSKHRELTPQQAIELVKLRKAGAVVVVVRSWEMFMSIHNEVSNGTI